MADFKNNHYVPEMLLKRFMSEDGDLFYYDKRKPEKSIEHRNPSSIFCQPNLYVDVNKAGKRNVTLERDVYSRLEGDTKPILDRIVTAARKSELPKLSPEEKSTWDQFFLQQWQRTPDAFAVIFNKFDFDEKFDSSVEESNFSSKSNLLNITAKASGVRCHCCKKNWSHVDFSSGDSFGSSDFRAAVTILSSIGFVSPSNLE